MSLVPRKSGNEKYREAGWKIFQAFEKHCRAPFGYSGLQNVDMANPQHHGKQVCENNHIFKNIESLISRRVYVS